MPLYIQMVFYACLHHSLGVTQLDLTGNWKHHHHAPVSRFIPAQMDTASLLYTAIPWYQWSYLSITIFHLKFNWTLLNTVCTSVTCVQIWWWHRHWELAQTVRVSPEQASEVQSVLVKSCAGQDQSSADRLLAFAVCSMRNTSPREPGNSAGRTASWGGEKALVFCSICLGGETCKWNINRLLHPFIWTNLKKKEQKLVWIGDTASHTGSSHLLREEGWGSTNKHLVFLIVIWPMNLKPCEIQRWEGFSQGAV